ncbi:hypothetical protein GLYMA_06G091033v4 [Glycine max]|nr:hypothetical protein GLYMA_06G091033v4 [Glycine max]KAH1124929.1 hypothetical protein GYH30_014533 [Glycine max]
MGVLNLAIVFPQMLVSLGSGPWDQLFGGGNSSLWCGSCCSPCQWTHSCLVYSPTWWSKAKPRSPV